MAAATRPFGVTLVAILTWISGAFGIIGGLVDVLDANGAVSTASIANLVIGVVTIAVGIGLLRGNAAARVLATIVLVLTVAAAVWGAFNGLPFWSAVGAGLPALIGLLLLYSRSASAFFRR